MKIIVFLVYQIGQLTPTGSKLCSKTINKGYSKYNPHVKTFDFDQQWNERLKRVKNDTRSCFPYPYRPKCTSQRGGWVLLVICKSLNLSSFLFLFYNFYRGIEMNLSWLVASIAVSPICFSKKHHCTNGLYYFSRTESFNSPKNRFIKCTWFRVFCTCFLCWVCRLIKSERSGESPSLSARRLCKTCTLNESFCKERDGLASLKNSFGKRLAKYIFLLFGDC